MGKNEIIMLCGDMNGHVGRSSSDYEGVHGGIGFRNQKLGGGKNPRTRRCNVQGPPPYYPVQQPTTHLYP